MLIVRHQIDINFMADITHPASEPRVYDPVGICIYCGSTEKLENEHIIPYGLQGNWILPKSSCRKCSNITKSFEGRLLRGVFLPARAAEGFQTRRPKERPKFYPIKVSREGKEEKINVTIDNHLTILTMPLFAPASYISKGHYEKGIDLIGTEIIRFSDSPEKIGKRLRADEISTTCAFQPVDFARMLAKIAYSFAVAEYGLSAIEEAYVLPAILGKKDDMGRWIGSDSFKFELEKKGALHILGKVVVDWKQNSDNEKLIVVKVKLFANSGISGYEVIVGRARG